jgi:hypothetical protein
MKAWWEVEEQIQAFLTSVLDTSEWQVLRFRNFTDGNQWLTADTDAVEKKKIPYPLEISKSESSVVQPATSSL